MVQSAEALIYSVKRRSCFLSYCWSEFMKIWAFRTPHFATLFIGLGTLLFDFSAYHFGELNTYLEEERLRSAFYAFTVLYYRLPATPLFWLFVVGFSLFCVCAESQHGMVRLVCTQPLSRVQCFLGKYLAVSAHVVLLTLVLLLCQFYWATIFSSLEGVTAEQWKRLALIAVYEFFYMLILCWLAMTAALFARNIVSGMLAAFGAWLGLAILDLWVPQSVARFLFPRYTNFAIASLFSPDELPWLRAVDRDVTLGGYLIAVCLTVVMMGVPSLWYFHRRDITE